MYVLRREDRILFSGRSGKPRRGKSPLFDQCCPRDTLGQERDRPGATRLEGGRMPDRLEDAKMELEAGRTHALRRTWPGRILGYRKVKSVLCAYRGRQTVLTNSSRWQKHLPANRQFSLHPDRKQPSQIVGYWFQDLCNVLPDCLVSEHFPEPVFECVGERRSFVPGCQSLL